MTSNGSAADIKAPGNLSFSDAGADTFAEDFVFEGRVLRRNAKCG
jgi:hypothetical protein